MLDLKMFINKYFYDSYLAACGISFPLKLSNNTFLRRHNYKFQIQNFNKDTRMKL